MKPLVSAFQAWSWFVILRSTLTFAIWQKYVRHALLTAFASTVISLFAIVILSVIGSLFARNHHTMMGLEKDPEDYAGVATSLFISVGVYGVSGKNCLARPGVEGSHEHC